MTSIRMFKMLVPIHQTPWRHKPEECDVHMPTLSEPMLHFYVHRNSIAKSRAVTGLLTGRNTLRRHLYLMGLSDSPLCRRCGAEDETSAHILRKCEALALFRHVYLGSFFFWNQSIPRTYKTVGPWEL
jgi:hypothetical protein